MNPTIVNKNHGLEAPNLKPELTFKTKMVSRAEFRYPYDSSEKIKSNPYRQYENASTARMSSRDARKRAKKDNFDSLPMLEPKKNKRLAQLRAYGLGMEKNCHE